MGKSTAGICIWRKYFATQMRWCKDVVQISRPHTQSVSSNRRSRLGAYRTFWEVALVAEPHAPSGRLAAVLRMHMAGGRRQGSKRAGGATRPWRLQCKHYSVVTTARLLET